MSVYSGPDRRGAINGLERDTFRELDTDDKLAVLYDSLASLHNLVYSLVAEKCPKQQEECEKRISAIEKQSLGNKFWSFGGGVVGGFIAIVSKWLLIDKG